jgi:hypothetical protein
LNIQSLNSKFDGLKTLVADLNSRNVFIDAIFIQETWKILHPELQTLPNYQNLSYINRSNQRGGGVGVYVKKGINFKIRDDINLYKQMTFECLTIELFYPNRNLIVSNIYITPPVFPLVKLNHLIMTSFLNAWMPN